MAEVIIQSQEMKEQALVHKKKTTQEFYVRTYSHGIGMDSGRVLTS